MSPKLAFTAVVALWFIILMMILAPHALGWILVAVAFIGINSLFSSLLFQALTGRKLTDWIKEVTK
jgi:hypothetical protein